jgi:stearoyl-CoA desaturase (Delta-9 desaturase)
MTTEKKIDYIGSIPFLSVHLACVLVLFVGFSWPAFWLCLAMTYIRLFGITAGFHRYFSHRTYKTSRWFQFVLACLGTSAAQMGPLWWAAHHRWHHRHSDKETDIHSPRKHGFFWAHIGWIMSPHNNATNFSQVRDLAKFPELRFLNRFYMIPPTVLAVCLFCIGKWGQAAFPHTGITAFQFLVWGFFISTVLLYHITFSINSLTHLIGRRRFQTNDDSRNSLLLGILILGEGWHNNHHRYPGSERQGIYWWEIDITHAILTALSWCGIVWDLHAPPRRIYEEAQAQA